MSRGAATRCVSENATIPPAESESFPLTREEVQRGLFPRTLDDLRFRTRCFAVLAAGDMEHRRKTAKGRK